MLSARPNVGNQFFNVHDVNGKVSSSTQRMGIISHGAGTSTDQFRVCDGNLCAEVGLFGWEKKIRSGGLSGVFYLGCIAFNTANLHEQAAHD